MSAGRYLLDVRSRRHFAVIGVVAVLVFGIVVGTWWLWPSGGASGPPRAVIVDQLALTDENSAFVDQASQLLGDAGYQVDYVPQTNVTVDFYRGLAKRSSAKHAACSSTCRRQDPQTRGPTSHRTSKNPRRTGVYPASIPHTT